MKTATASAIVLALSALAAGQAFAENSANTYAGTIGQDASNITLSKTRDQVRAELADAQRTGNIVGDKNGTMMNELFPTQYPAEPVVAGKTRAEVRAELAEALRTGDIVVDKNGAKLNQLFPTRYSSVQSITNNG